MLKDEYHELINEGTTDRDPGLDSAIRETDNFLSTNDNLKQRHEMHLLPVEAYLHFPKLSDQIQINPKDEKDILRLLFKNVEYTKYEKNKLQELYENLKKLNSKNKGILLPLWWDDSESIRFLQASEFNIKKTITTITSQINWTDSFYPFQLTDNINLILNSGLMYMCGRDKNFRPIIIVKASKISYLVEKIKIKMEDIQKATAYFLNYIIIYQMIPGQLENWLIISDVSKVGITEFGYFKKLMDILSKFRGRVYRNFIIGMNVILRSCAKGALAIFGSSSKKKIKFVNEKEIFEELKQYVNIQYIPQIYGGNQVELQLGNNNLFPPNFPIFSSDIPEDLMTEDEYKHLCYNSSRNLIICPQLKKKWKEEEELKKEMEKKIEEEKLINENDCISENDNWINLVKDFENSFSIPDEGKYLTKYKPFINELNDTENLFKIRHMNSAYYFE